MRIAAITLVLSSLVLSGCIVVEETVSDDDANVTDQGPPIEGVCGTHQDCAVGELCAFSMGTCGSQGGVCVAATPDLQCDGYEAPICGCDGQTYLNGCEAWLVGVSIAHEGACTAEPPPPEAPESPDENGPQDCGGTLCGAGEFCDYADGSCGDYGSQAGSCRLINAPCTGSASAVCGCDGITYETECDAITSGVSVRHKGAC